MHTEVEQSVEKVFERDKTLRTLAESPINHALHYQLLVHQSRPRAESTIFSPAKERRQFIKKTCRHVSQLSRSDLVSGVERGRLDRSGPHHAAAHPHPQPTSPLSTYTRVIAVVKVLREHLLQVSVDAGARLGQVTTVYYIQSESVVVIVAYYKWYNNDS